jgi:AraC-like DNA-binding protein
MRPIPLVRGWTVLPAVRFLRGVGSPVYRWLEASGIPARILDTPSRSLPVASVFAFVERAARAEGAETLGLDLGRRVSAESFGAWGRMLVGTPTIYERLALSAERMRLEDTSLELWLEVDGPKARLCFRYVDGLGPGVVHGEDFTLMVCLEIFRRALGDDWRPEELALVRPRGERFRRDEMFRDVRVCHGGSSNQLTFPVEVLQRPLPLLPGPIGHEAETSVAEHAPSTDLCGSVRDTVTALLTRGHPSVEEVADIAGTSVRSLQRELARTGLTYSKVVDQSRFSLAKEYLEDPSASVTEIALQLGYGDGTAFSRAFRRWSGVTPSQHRKRLARAA